MRGRGLRHDDELWERIVGFEPLCRAARRAARGKRGAASVARFLERLEPRVLDLERELRAGTYRPGEPTCFEIHDPKTRTISAAPFRDRVVHHALMEPLEPLFERRMVAWSFACRRGKGTHAALDHAQGLVRRFRYFHRFDVARCFDSIVHARVMERVERCVKEPRVLELMERVLASGGRAGRGLAIGSLTSQWCANLLLDRLDHHVLEVLRPGGYVRYMDDFVLFADGKAELRAMRERVVGFLRARLELEAKERALVLGHCADGLPFLGWRLYPGLRRVRPENLRRMRRRLAARGVQAERGGWEQRAAARGTESLLAHLAAGDTRRLVRSLCGEGGNGTTARRGSARGRGAGSLLLQPREPRRQLRQHRQERAVGEPQQERAGQLQPEPRFPSPRQGAAPA